MKKNEIKILLTSDLHLGINEHDVSISQSARINTFKRITNLAAEHDILLIAGDLINDVNIDPAIIDIIQSEFAMVRQKNTEILLAPGPGELNKDNSIPSFLFDLHTSFIFSSPEISTPYHYTKEDQNIYFYGVPSSYNNDIAEIKKTNDEGFHIGIFHVEFDVENKENNTSLFKLQKKSFKDLELDFYALGHNHNFKMFKAADRIIGTYPGSPEAVSFNETGDRYVISITLKKNEIFHIKRMTVNSVKVNSSDIDCSDPNSINTIFNILNDNMGGSVIQRLKLTGGRDYILNPGSIDKFRDQYLDIIIIDESTPSVQSLINEYASEDTIRGEFFKALKEDLNNNNIPADVDLTTLAMFLHLALTQGFDKLDEWLCR